MLAAWWLFQVLQSNQPATAVAREQAGHSHKDKLAAAAAAAAAAAGAGCDKVVWLLSDLLYDVQAYEDMAGS